MMKTNCWEYKNCGRQPGGEKVDELGVCPATIFVAGDGFCEGHHGGRACVYIAGTLCAGTIQGTHKEKEKNCARCDFFKDLKKEHGAEMNVFAFDRYVKNKEE